jgi:hypothetical protein
LTQNKPQMTPAENVKKSEFSELATRKGVGNTDFTAMHKIDVTVTPSSICEAYAIELYESMDTTIQYLGSNIPLPFTAADMYVYLCIIMRERINAVRKRHVLFRPSDSDVKIPHFFYLAMTQLGDVVDESRHIWIEVAMSESDFVTANGLLPGAKRLSSEFKRFKGMEHALDFVYTMSRDLKMLERQGFVNGSGLPRTLLGELSFMLFMWEEERLLHCDPAVEPGTAVLASLISFQRAVTLLNPYISYGISDVYRLLLKEVTSPRGGQKPTTE